MNFPRRVRQGIGRLIRLFAADRFSMPGVVLPLLLGTLALMAFFLVPPTQYRNTNPLFENTAASGRANAVKDIPVLVRSLEEPGQTAKRDEEADLDRESQTRQRAGVNILIRSGYLDVAREIRASADSQPRYEVAFNQAPLTCARQDNDVELDSDRAARAVHLALAVVAVEKFNRGPLQRHAEWMYARLFFAVTGHVPDLSFGPAQIRMTTARRAVALVNLRYPLAPPLANGDNAIVGYLADECTALRLTSVLMYDLLIKAEQQCRDADAQDECEVASVATAFNGGHRTTHAIIDYAPVVGAMSGIIVNN